MFQGVLEQAWWHMHIIPAFTRQRQAYLCEPEACYTCQVPGQRQRYIEENQTNKQTKKTKKLGSFSLWLLASFPFLSDGRLGLEWGVVGNVPFNFFGRILRIKHASIGNEVNDRTAPILSLG